MGELIKYLSLESQHLVAFKIKYFMYLKKLKISQICKNFYKNYYNIYIKLKKKIIIDDKNFTCRRK